MVRGLSSRIGGVLCAALAWTAPVLTQPVEGELPSLEPAGAVDERLRTQLHDFAPFVSMRGGPTLGERQPAAVIEILEDWTRRREITEDLYNAHPALQTAHRDFRAFLVESHAAVLPALRSLQLPHIEVDPLEHPEVALASMFLASLAEINRNQIVSNWQRDLDLKRRAAFARVYPLLKRAATGVPYSDRSVRVRHWFARDLGVFIEILNDSSMDLRNVALRVTMWTIDGRNAEHYYFFPIWTYNPENADANRVFLRPAADWWPIGAEATTGVTVELVSDQIIVEGLRFEIDDHVPTAADKVMDEIEPQVARRLRPKQALNRLEFMRDRLRTYPDRYERLNRLLQQARTQFNEALESLDARIKKSEDRIEDLRRQRPRNDRERERRDKNLKAEQENLKTLQDRRRKLLKGEDLPPEPQVFPPGIP